MKSYRLLSIFFYMLCAIAAWGQEKVLISTSTEINASTLPDDAIIEFQSSNKTLTLNMDVDKRLSYIEDASTNFNLVDWNLIIKGSKKLSFTDNSLSHPFIRVNELTINEGVTVEAVSSTKTAKAIEVRQLTVRGKLLVSGTADAAYAHGGITVDGGSLTAVSSYDAIHAVSGDIVLNGTVSAVGGEIAINAKQGNVIVNGGTVEAEGEVDGIYAEGSISLQGGSVTVKAIGGSNPSGLHAKGNITVSGSASCYTVGDAFGLRSDGDITMEGGTFTSMGKQAVSAVGNIALNGGSLSAIAFIGSNTTVRAGGTLHFNGTLANITYLVSTGKAVYAEQGITLSQGAMTLPANGKISSNGKTIVRSDGNEAKRVTIGLPEISGKINITHVACMYPTEYSLKGEIASVASSKISAQWQYSDADAIGNDMTWTDISGATGTSYTPPVSLLGKYIRVKVTARGYTGYLASGAGFVTKIPQNSTPATPTLQVANNKVYVTNAIGYQEYIMLSSQKAVASLTASDWSNAKSPSSTTATSVLDMGGTMGNTYFVYTRYKETDTYYAGEQVAVSSIYLGSAATTVQAIAFKVEKDVRTGTKPQYTEEIEREGDAYYANVGNVFRITVQPSPEDATFAGISGSRFYSSAKGGTFYSDYKCTTPVSSTTNYTQVYFKTTTQKNNVDASAEYTRGYNDVLRAVVYFHVADASGNWLISRIGNVETTVDVGKKLEGISIVTKPGKASLAGLTAEFSSGTGTAPTITFDKSTHTMTVDATSASTGTYTYTVKQNGSNVSGTIKVNVVGLQCENIVMTPLIEAEPGDVVELSAQVLPAGAEATLQWSCSSPYATVNNGVVTISSSIPRNTIFDVNATTGNISAETSIYIPKLPSDLSFDKKSCQGYVGGPVTTPVLNNPHQLPVNYGSSDTNVAKVNSSSGEVELVGEGVATILASTVGDANYASDEVSYWISVSKKAASGIDVLKGDTSTTIRKVIVDGQVLIIRPDGRLCNLLGVEVK